MTLRQSKLIRLIETLQRPDPVYNGFMRLFKGKGSLAALSSAALNLLIWIAVSQIIRASQPGMKVVYHNDLDELTFGLFLWGFFVPVLWWFYLTVPIQWRKMVEEVSKNQVVDEEFQEVLKPTTYPLLPLVIAIGVGFLYYLVGMQAEISADRFSFWFVYPWSQMIITLMVMFNSYIFLTFVLSTVIYSTRLAIYFYQHGVKRLRVFEGPECGGLSAVGFLAMRITSLAVLVGVWAIWFALLPVFAGGKPNFSFMVILLYFAYVVLAVLLLTALTYPAHRAMLRYKISYKNHLSSKLEGLLADYSIFNRDSLSSPEGQSSLPDEYFRLLFLYERVDALPEWPISRRNLNRFTGFASLPGVIGLFSFILDMFNLTEFARQLMR